MIEHSQGSEVVEDGLPGRAVTVHDFSEVTWATIFTSKICRCVMLLLLLLLLLLLNQWDWYSE